MKRRQSFDLLARCTPGEAVVQTVGGRCYELNRNDIP